MEVIHATQNNYNDRRTVSAVQYMRSHILLLQCCNFGSKTLKSGFVDTTFRSEYKTVFEPVFAALWTQVSPLRRKKKTHLRLN